MLTGVGSEERDLVIHGLLQGRSLLREVPFGPQQDALIPHGVGRKNALHEQFSRSLVLGDEAGGEVAPDQRELLTVGDLGGMGGIPLEHGIEVVHAFHHHQFVDAQCAVLVEEHEQVVDFGFGLHGQFLVMRGGSAGLQGRTTSTPRDGIVASVWVRGSGKWIFFGKSEGAEAPSRFWFRAMGVTSPPERTYRKGPTLLPQQWGLRIRGLESTDTSASGPRSPSARRGRRWS